MNLSLQLCVFLKHQIWIIQTVIDVSTILHLYDIEREPLHVVNTFGGTEIITGFYS